MVVQQGSLRVFANEHHADGLHLVLRGAHLHVVDSLGNGSLDVRVTDIQSVNGALIVECIAVDLDDRHRLSVGEEELRVVSVLVRDGRVVGDGQRIDVAAQTSYSPLAFAVDDSSLKLVDVGIVVRAGVTEVEASVSIVVLGILEVLVGGSQLVALEVVEVEVNLNLLAEEDLQQLLAHLSLSQVALGIVGISSRNVDVHNHVVELRLVLCLLVAGGFLPVCVQLGTDGTGSVAQRQLRHDDTHVDVGISRIGVLQLDPASDAVLVDTGELTVLVLLERVVETGHGSVEVDVLVVDRRERPLHDLRVDTRCGGIVNEVEATHVVVGIVVLLLAVGLVNLADQHGERLGLAVLVDVLVSVEVTIIVIFTGNFVLVPDFRRQTVLDDVVQLTLNLVPSEDKRLLVFVSTVSIELADSIERTVECDSLLLNVVANLQTEVTHGVDDRGIVGAVQLDADDRLTAQGGVVGVYRHAVGTNLLLTDTLAVLVEHDVAIGIQRVLNHVEVRAITSVVALSVLLGQRQEQSLARSVVTTSVVDGEEAVGQLQAAEQVVVDLLVGSAQRQCALEVSLHVVLQVEGTLNRNLVDVLAVVVAGCRISDGYITSCTN